jgi:DNA polymerase I-like protein with 3'-5' exonuclease and polymerase domains
MMRGFDERNAINAPIQGTEAEMIKLDMGRISTDGLERPSWTPR